MYKKAETTQIIGTWRSYKRVFNNQVKHDDDSNWKEWIFEEGGKAHFLLCKDNKTITDFIDRYWTLEEKQEGDAMIQFLTITPAGSKNKIVSIEKEDMVLQNDDGLFTHFTSIMKWHELIKN